MPIREHTDVSALIGDIIDTGFAVVRRDSRMQRAYDALFAMAPGFFANSPSLKLACAMSEGSNTGYTPVGIEYSISPDMPDQKESITYVPAEAAAAARHPAFVQELYAAMQSCVDVIHPLSLEVMGALARSFGSDDPIYAPDYSQLALNSYAVTTASHDTLIEPHEDGCLVTVLSSTAPGLQICLRSGEYITCTDVIEHFVLLAGGTLTLATGGRVPPTFHRVVRVPGVSARYTIAWDMTADLKRTIRPWTGSDVRVDDEARMTLTRFGLAPLGQSSN